MAEMLMYTAELKLPLKLSLATKRERVAVLLQQLALTTCQAVKIGGAMNKGISGEHCRAMLVMPVWQRLSLLR